MTDPIRKPRRWPWAILAAVLLLIGGQIAWSSRPLNATERMLLGTWENNPQFRLRFCADRRCYRGAAVKEGPLADGTPRISAPFDFHGTWKASGDSISIDSSSHVAMPWPVRVQLILRRITERNWEPLHFDGPDHFSMGAHPFHRIPDSDLQRDVLD